MERFRDIYRIPSTRLQKWDYGWNGLYFVTICTAGHDQWFGTITDGIMKLSPIGRLAHQFWLEIPSHFPFVEPDVFVIMPNHVHGILVFDKNDDESRMKRVPVETRQCLVSTRPPSTIPPPSMSRYNSPGKNRQHNQGRNTLSSVVGSYKSIVSKHAHYIHPAFEWQSRFYDHIIRSDESFNRIREYIESNPRKWENDKFYN